MRCLGKRVQIFWSSVMGFQLRVWAGAFGMWGLRT